MGTEPPPPPPSEFTPPAGPPPPPDPPPPPPPEPPIAAPPPAPPTSFPAAPSPSVPTPTAPAGSGAGRASSTIVFVLALLFLANTFLAWQRLCVKLPAGLVIGGQFCVHANIWHGNAAGLGWIAGIAAILLLLWEGAALAGARIDLGADHRSVTAILAGALFIGGVLKWVLVLGNYAGPGAWIGLILAICLTGYVALQPRIG